MASDNCCLSCTDVRYGTRAVAIFDFWVGVILMIKFLSLLYPFSESENPYVFIEPKKRVSSDLSIFGHLFLISLVLYVNYNLKDSTYDRDISKIHQWLVVNTILLLFYVSAIIYVAVKYNWPEIPFFSAPLCAVHLCQIFVVRCFYNNVLESLFRAAIDRNTVINQNMNNGSTTVTVVPTSGYQFQDGNFMTAPYRYPNSGIVVYPSPNDPTAGQMSHEYSNPPPYTPAYDPQTCNPPGENVPGLVPK